jgi:hypothetical protein
MTHLESQLANVLLDILQLAHDCRSDMQGRLVDDEHKRVFNVLGSIERRATEATQELFNAKYQHRG